MSKISIQSLPIDKRMDFYDKVMRIRRKKGLSARKISQKLGISERTVESWIYEGARPDGNVLSRRWNPNLSPTPELSYLLGSWYSDCWKTNIKQASLEATDREYVEEYSRCFSEVIGRESTYDVKRRETGTGRQDRWRVNCSSKLLLDYLREPLDRHKEVIEKQPFEFLKGFGDGDGSVDFWINKRDYKGKKYAYPRWEISLHSTDKSLLFYIKKILKEKVGVSHVNEKKDTRGHREQPLYSLRISRQKDLLKWYNEVGFTIERKQRKLEEAVEYIEKRKNEA